MSQTRTFIAVPTVEGDGQLVICVTVVQPRPEDLQSTRTVWQRTGLAL